MPDIISKQDALRLGRKRFYTGRPCKYGHDSERYTTTGNCIACLHPKIPEADKPEPVASFRLANGRVVELLSQEQAYRMRRKYFFTGQPCDEGHMAERDVSSGRCLQCMHPPKYGPDGFTGWWPFQPKPPLRVPPGTPLSVWHELAKRLQDEIPRIVKELGVEIPPEPTFTSALGVPHRYLGQVWQGLKVWWPYPERARENNQGLDSRITDPTVPWVNDEGVWYGVLKDGTKVAAERNSTYDPDTGQRESAKIAAELAKRKV